MRLLVIIFVVTFICTVYAGGNCVQAFCYNEIKQCREDSTCQQHIAKCTNDFRKNVKKAQDSKAYKGTEHALDDVQPFQSLCQFNYCMRTHQGARAINDCSARHCLKTNLIGIDIEIENLEKIIA
ncbi:unnamed protein product (macronuclear) [Paramecium tetraurelia]|uniref:Uncharacterized protein n=1 Tax=Paramecium tetraurelia TaxID=5888 RepID=A0BER2_PARTE|nr:uncharacterized protein GSPATT00028062001 [Paramecium tetraurelia]CAK57029.1 unnamed protein product [Paramecium tetraurelia]|eukprot:XP_001424427.1 hypothetical protein (macronuclear) [Paramecium tetraurelia strain d4-2]